MTSASAKGVTTSDQEHQPVIKQFAVYERIQLNWQPVDGDVHDAITQAFLEAEWSRNSIERQHDTGGGSPYSGSQGQASKTALADCGMLMRKRRCDVPGSNPLASARVARRASNACLIAGYISFATGVGDRPWRVRAKRSSLHASRRRDKAWLVADWLSAR